MKSNLEWFVVGILVALAVIFRGPAFVAGYKAARAGGATRSHALGQGALYAVGLKP